MKNRICLGITLGLLALMGYPDVGDASDFKREVIYQIVTDRFFDGDTTNNDPAQSAGLYDTAHTTWGLYWGGDFAGIRQKIPYLKEMGITAIWISPPVDNRNVNVGGGAPYHGYAARDMKTIEEHFGDASNGWAAFDSMVAAAHDNGIKVIVDFVPNHMSDRDTGEKGAIYDSGVFLGDYDNDTGKYYHRNPGISNWDDRYQIQYYTLFNLADLDQENTATDTYLKQSAKLFAEHGVDGFRIDAVKHATWGWQYSMTNAMYAQSPIFVFGEWFQGTTGDAHYWDSYKFANKSGMSLLDYPLYTEIRDVFVNNANFQDIENVLATENTDFKWKNALVTFINNHDKPRFLSQSSDTHRFHQAMAFQLTCRGIPIVYYGDEQYLHADTNGGDDPYNRPMMESFDTTTTAFQLIQKLAALRRSNNAIPYGSHKERWINSDVYIFERQFYENVALIAINKSSGTNYSIGGLLTSLPSGTYSDYLGGLLDGMSITVTGDTPNNNPVNTFTLTARTVAVWQYTKTPDTPQVGSIWPTIGHPGITVSIVGEKFGASQGSIHFGSNTASIVSWTDSEVVFKVPDIADGLYNVELKNSVGTPSKNKIDFTVLTDTLIPVTFTVKNASPTSVGDHIFLTGSTVELSKWSTSRNNAIGPMLAPNYPDWFINMAMPAGATIEFKFIKIEANDNVTWEAGANHSYTVPNGGTGFVDVNWQY